MSMNMFVKFEDNQIRHFSELERNDYNYQQAESTRAEAFTLSSVASVPRQYLQKRPS